ncbi:uncharacterized protein MONBRDRAFT_20211 [Monosiga brevicollis MX1]|uniref:Dynein axonemal heavy chain 2 n=1 Tax=Monosiga brevicollis TaxID=81824 RepID=A9UUZ7_MONBE|nr:uncharacterized protein MONBRDRAFT_20211 [Monosiga brevicollis MX1]EDQ90997.1 predicted protein [Monosiga brevicollis MX1]|eukprot:XP_001744294.1 hypothetical protein [Monosiga brevicollis MX1]
MSDIYAPLLTTGGSWPDSVRNEFSAGLNRFMSALTEASNRSAGKTVLYIPNEELSDAAIQDRDLLQRLDSTVIQWTRLLRQVLSSTSVEGVAAIDMPLDEIAYWRQRQADMSGIHAQLDQPKAQRILSLLKAANSSYVSQFESWASKIAEGMSVSESNFKFLSVLADPCTRLNTLGLNAIPERLPELVDLVRMIWLHSQHYNSREQITSLFQKLSNAIISRCCECIAHFARRQGAGTRPPPLLAGTRGPELSRSLEQLEANFAASLQQLRQVQDLVFDVKSNKFQHEFVQFKASLKELEVLMQGIIGTAFETATSVEQGVELLTIFAPLRARETLRRALNRHTDSVFKRFNDELEHVKQVFSKQRDAPPVGPTMPKYAGACMWALALRTNIDQSQQLLTSRQLHATSDAGHRGDEATFSNEVLHSHSLLSNALADFANKTHAAWVAQLGTDLKALLEISLMKRRPDRRLALNFDPSLERLFREIQYFDKLGMSIPAPARDIFHRSEELRCLRDMTMLVVRDYNRIYDLLADDEQQLFSRRIQLLDNKVHNGLTKLTWDKAKFIKEYVNTVRANAATVRKQVDNYLASKAYVRALCDTAAQRSLFVYDAKTMYEPTEFAQQQERYVARVLSRLGTIHQKIVAALRATYKDFSGDPSAVQSAWKLYVAGIDERLQNALVTVARRSLSELNRALHGDGKTLNAPLFKVGVLLDDASSSLLLQPSFDFTYRLVNTVADRIMAGLVVIPRLLAAVSQREVKDLPSYEAAARADRDVRVLLDRIARDMDKCRPEAEAFAQGWRDRYYEIWATDKARFIERYIEMQPSLAKFDGDIARYGEVSHNVQKEETFVILQFLHLDTSLLKFALLDHCKEWQTRLSQVLHDQTVQELADLHAYLEEQARLLRQRPEGLDAVIASVALYDEARKRRESTQQRFAPLKERFEILHKYDVSISAQVEQSHLNLAAAWTSFNDALREGAALIEEAKSECKSGLLASLDELARNAAGLRSQFLEDGPTSGSLTPEQALKAIDTFKAKVETTRQAEQALKNGLQVFDITQEPFQEILDTVKDLGHLEQLWRLAEEWDNNFISWRDTQFADIVTDDLAQTATSFNKRLLKMLREVKDKDWEMTAAYRNKIDQFRRTMPLIEDLKNPALRERHWSRLQGHVGENFSHTSEEFTLGRMIELGFDRFNEEVGDISRAASKELSIEQTLAGITEVWATVELEAAAHKERGHFILKGTDDIYQLLEDDQIKLATMKASPFVKAFEADVDRWEKTLGTVLEVVDMLLTVQRQWIYLENIFLGEDIRQQLPEETKQFDLMDAQFKDIGVHLHKDCHACRATHRDGLLAQLVAMNGVLEQIQKSLDEYLETKRQAFPRFYFVSNDDLLEILGQSKNPPAVQPHLLKCFDNVKSLELHNAVGRSQVQALGMTSADAEYVPFKTAVALDGPVEVWLTSVETEMRHTLKQLLQECMVAHRKQKRDKWLKEWPGQLVLTVSQMAWTSECFKAISDKKHGAKAGLKAIKKKQVSLLNKLTEAVRAVKNKTQRKKLVALITIEVHSRDVIDRLLKVANIDQNAFEWLMQLRFYWEKPETGPSEGECIIRQTNTHFSYGYEYSGNSGRLVITPLTDRCYMTLTTALHLKRGGSPKGPAGTGKTETVKDLGKSLGDYVIVINCSDGMDYKSLGVMFRGLAQTGAWGCFDEFNRINIEVLSVVAQQILSILSAQIPLSPENPKTRFTFEGMDINLLWSCGIFITMNPGYAGRTELPDNLKSMFRPISMMKPDTQLIAEIILFGQGFNNTRVLAKKADTLYKLAAQQLSKQDHYDYGLRAMVSTLLYAGRKREAMPEMPHEEVLLLAMKDMNVAKMTGADLPLLQHMMSDLFPGVETMEVEYGAFREAIKADLVKQGYQATPWMITKAIQLFETKNSRHSVMIVGRTGSGKSVAWHTLQRAMTQCARDNVEGFVPVREYPLNPKALSLAELYGEFNIATNEWTDGVLSSVMRNVCSDEKPDQKWIVFDGPVDTLWIESMNSVMDDNKILTLINGDRISMPAQVSLLFEVEDLAVASPATVSRCGMVYHDTADLGWQPYVTSWLSNPRFEAYRGPLQALFEKYVERLLDFVRHKCEELVETSLLSRVTSLCNLLDAFLVPENGIDPADKAHFARLLEQWFLFACVWSLCAGVNEAGRKLVDNFIREIEGQFPAKDTVYEYFVDVKNHTWAHWEKELSAGWKYAPDASYHSIQVPTVDTVRYEFLLSNLIAHQRPTLMVGPVGTGKTSVVELVMAKLDAAQFNRLTINMSSQTSSNNVQEIIEGQVEKRTKGVFVPLGGKQLLTFLDDLNMPAKDTFGSQPPLELLRQLMEYGFMYDRQKQVLKHIKDMRVVAAMGPPGGGRSVISRRLQSRFNVINMTFPSRSQIQRIFGTMINQKLQDFDEACKPVGDMVTNGTIDVYEYMSTRMLPTPAKIHYLFNLRDISKVFQGLLRAHKDVHDTTDALSRLWVHECFRVFCDRLISSSDVAEFTKLIEDKLHELFNISYSTLCPNRVVPVFADFLKAEDNPVYEDVRDPQVLRRVLQERLDEYNESGFVPMDLVLFRDAIEHVCRVVRVVRCERGNMLLIGVGGSGRQSLTRLASYVLEFKVFQIEVTRQYRINEFREDLKTLYRQAGLENKPTVFLFTDTQIVIEDFLEDINNILSSGEVPNLFAPDELEEIRNELAPLARKQGLDESPVGLYKYFISRVRNNLRVVLCMSPVGEAFRNRLRMYPGLVNCTTIDYFHAWPEDALLAVAHRYMHDVDFGTGEDGEAVRKAVSSTFAVIQQSVLSSSAQMLEELKRHNYVTPTNYLELVMGYKQLLAEKRRELGDAADKLANGLGKIDETSAKVEQMSIELVETKKQVAEFQRECEEYLVIIVQQKREADDQQMAVSQRSEKISVEAKQCQKLASDAQADLDEALPALESAMEALNSLNKGDITEIKSYSKPPDLVAMVMEAVMVLRKSKPDWAEAKRQLGDTNFINQLIEFDKDNMSEKTLKKVRTYVVRPEFDPDVVGRVSNAARSLCMWVRAMDVYGRIFKVVEPKRQALQAAQTALKAKEDSLAEAEAKLREVTEKVAKLQSDYESKLQTKEELRIKSEQTEIKLERAAKLVSGLAGERSRWEQSVGELRRGIKFLVGDCLMCAGFLSYLGPFISEYRARIVEQWRRHIRDNNIPSDPDFSMTTLLAKATDVRFWNIQGLPSDQFSTENGVIVTRGRRWPLMIDPQGQAIKWIKNMERDRKLQVVDMQQPDYIRTLENAIQFGTPVLMQNVGEELDPSLAPVLNKAFTKVGGRLMLKLGDKEIEYNPDFRFYLTTKMSNPHYTPEISTKTTIVNFAVVQQGLEAQLLGIVVSKERPELEKQKNELVLNIAAGKKKLVDLEDKILQLLSSAKGSLLDDEELVNTLNTSKVTSVEVSEQLVVAEATEKEIDAAREGYRPSASRASVLFFVLDDVSKIDPMYQFSLDAYINLYTLSIDNSAKAPALDQRIESINEYHNYAVYRYTCRGLFEKHKLLFALHMNAKILESQNKIALGEYNFFLRGGQVLDRDAQVPNPAPGWITSEAWDNVTEMERLLPKFAGLTASFEQQLRDWQAWYVHPEPETAPLPGEWQATCNELQRMCIVRALRPDRVAIVAIQYIVNNLGQRFVEPPPLDMNAVLADSNAMTPLIFVLSVGVDPTKQLLDLAERSGMSDRFHSLSLGQGQAPIAERLIAEGASRGDWVFLANCHLSLSWMPSLSKLVELLESQQPHPDFRLWLSSKPDPRFPISILQAGIKMTTEPPNGIKANMKRLYNTISEEQFERCNASSKYKKLMFSLTFFHSILLERRKFQMLGWNVQYPFNDSDFEVSENLLALFLDEYEETPWESLKYLIAGINYGGHVTDDWDRRLLLTYINELFSDQVLQVEACPVSASPLYFVPPDGPLQSYKDYINTLPGVDPPTAFGQNANADISSMIREARTLLGTLVSMQPAVSAKEGGSREDKVLELARDMLARLPKTIDYEATAKLLAADPRPLNIVLLQEIQRYNRLLEAMRVNLVDLDHGIQGLVVMSHELEQIFECIYQGEVPVAWKATYPSQKPLASWMRDLVERIEFLTQWAVTGRQPLIFWMSAFSFPTGFLTAVLQQAARSNGVSIDTLSWEFSVMTVDDVNIVEEPRDGVYVRGLFLEGAGWDKRNACLVEAEAMQLVSSMPTIHFKPVENKKVAKKGSYACPCYYYPNRTGEGGASAWSFVISVDLKTGDLPPEHWVKRGTALLMSLDS